MENKPQEEQATVLVIDDDIVIRSIAKSIFTNSNFKVIEADCGEMALEILPSIMPDIVLLDILMPGINGFEVLKKIRADDKLKNLKVILLSSQNDINERLKGYDLGADSYITKPFIGNELLAKVRVFSKLQHIEVENATLVDLINKEIAKRKEKEDFIKEQEKLTHMNDLIVTISHHWRQPLNALSVIIEDIYDAFLHGELSKDYLCHSVQQSLKQIKFMSNTIDSFQHTINSQKYNSIERLNFLTAISKSLTELYHIFSTSNTTCLINGRDYLQFIQTSTLEYYIYADPQVIQQIITTILLATYQSIIHVYKKCEPVEKENTINIKLFRDDETIQFISYSLDAKVLPDEEMDNIFEPYYIFGEGRFSSEGVSLYFTKMIVEQNIGGKLYLKNNQATELHMELPLKRKEG